MNTESILARLNEKKCDLLRQHADLTQQDELLREQSSDEDEGAIVGARHAIRAQIERAGAEIKKISAALTRAHSAPDDFGTCADCGDEIGERLLAVPETVFCIHCAMQKRQLQQKRYG